MSYCACALIDLGASLARVMNVTGREEVHRPSACYVVARGGGGIEWLAESRACADCESPVGAGFVRCQACMRRAM
jgi:hypothetical protein